jgi:hypothetical protein
VKEGVNLNRWGLRDWVARDLIRKIVARTIGVKLRDIRLLYLVIVLKPHARSTALRPSAAPYERVIVGGEAYSPEQTTILAQALDKSRRADETLNPGTTP